MQHVRSAVAVVGLTLLASGCFVYTDDNPPIIVIARGTVTIDWTVDGTKDPNACRALLADRIEVTLFDLSRTIAFGTYAQLCEAFATSISLEPGTYSADALLVDTAGYPRTTTVQLPPFRILGSDRLTLPIDFPTSSFF